MKTIAILLALIATGTLLLGPVTATAGGSDASAKKIDLRPVGGPMLYLACQHGNDLSSPSCGVISLWQETNGDAKSVLGNSLQIAKYDGRYDPDLDLAP